MNNKLVVCVTLRNADGSIAKEGTKKIYTRMDDMHTGRSNRGDYAFGFWYADTERPNGTFTQDTCLTWYANGDAVKITALDEMLKCMNAYNASVDNGCPRMDLKDKLIGKGSFTTAEGKRITVKDSDGNMLKDSNGKLITKDVRGYAKTSLNDCVGGIWTKFDMIQVMSDFVKTANKDALTYSTMVISNKNRKDNYKKIFAETDFNKNEFPYLCYVGKDKDGKEICYITGQQIKILLKSLLFSLDLPELKKVGTCYQIKMNDTKTVECFFDKQELNCLLNKQTIEVFKQIVSKDELSVYTLASDFVKFIGRLKQDD